MGRIIPKRSIDRWEPISSIAFHPLRLLLLFAIYASDQVKSMHSISLGCLQQIVKLDRKSLIVHLTELRDADLVNSEVIDDHRFYKISEKGYEFLRDFELNEKIIEPMKHN